MVKLPKQWRDWCRRAGLRQHNPGRRDRGSWFYLKGRGHVWRVNCHGKLQCGDTYADFDRWALCDIVETAIPSCLTQLVGLVDIMAGLADQPELLAAYNHYIVLTPTGRIFPGVACELAMNLIPLEAAALLPVRGNVHTRVLGGTMSKIMEISDEL